MKYLLVLLLAMAGCASTRQDITHNALYGDLIGSTVTLTQDMVVFKEYAETSMEVAGEEWVTGMDVTGTMAAGTRLRVTRLILKGESTIDPYGKVLDGDYKGGTINLTWLVDHSKPGVNFMADKVRQ